MVVKAYLHSEKESMWEVGEKAGLSEKQLELFKFALYEVEFDLLVDDKGSVKILRVNGKKLQE